MEGLIKSSNYQNAGLLIRSLFTTYLPSAESLNAVLHHFQHLIVHLDRAVGRDTGTIATLEETSDCGRIQVLSVDFNYFEVEKQAHDYSSDL